VAQVIVQVARKSERVDSKQFSHLGKRSLEQFAANIFTVFSPILKCCYTMYLKPLFLLLATPDP